MSDAAPSAEAAAAAPGDEPPKKKRGKRLLIVAVVAILLAGGGAGAFFFLSHGDTAHPEGGAKGAGHPDASPPKKKVEYDGPPVYQRLEPATVNLAGGSGNFLAANVELKLAEPKVAEDLKIRAPEIRNLVLMTLSAQRPEDIANAEGKAKLAQKLREEINKIVKLDQETGVIDVFFTEFIMQ